MKSKAFFYLLCLLLGAFIWIHLGWLGAIILSLALIATCIP